MQIEQITKQVLNDISTSELRHLRLRSKQYFEKYVNINTNEFFEKYQVLMDEFETRNISCNEWQLDKMLKARINVPSEFRFHVLGNCKYWIEYENRNIVITPTIQNSEIGRKIDALIITGKDYADDTIGMDTSLYSEPPWNNIPVHSLGTIINTLPPIDYHPMFKTLYFGSLYIDPLRMIYEEGNPVMGILISLHNIKISILPKFLKLIPETKNMLSNSTWFCDKGSVNYNALQEYAKELKPSKIYIVGRRKLSDELKAINAEPASKNKIFRLEDFKPVREDLEQDTLEAVKSIKKELWNCECLDCGNIVKTSEHCNTIDCPKCGGEMRRADRPGIGKDEFVYDKEKFEKSLENPSENSTHLRKNLDVLASIYTFSENDTEMAEIEKTFAKTIDALRSVYFPMAPIDLRTKEAQTPFWRLYKAAKDFMTIDPPSDECIGLWDRKRSFVVKEEIEKKEIQIFDISKGKDEQIICGIIYETDEIDTDGDTANMEEILKASNYFMEKVLKYKLMHKYNFTKIKLLQNVVAPTSFEMKGRTIQRGTWYQICHILDKEVWNDIKSGKITGFSMAGTATVE